MARIEGLVPGQVLHDYHRYKTNGGMKEGHWLATVVEVDLSTRSVKISWNSNPERWVSEHAIAKYRVNPKPENKESTP